MAAVEVCTDVVQQWFDKNTSCASRTAVNGSDVVVFSAELYDDGGSRGWIGVITYLGGVWFVGLRTDMKVHFDMTMRQKAVFECLRAPHAQDFLLAISIDGFGQHMSPVEYRTILKYRLMILLFPVDAIFPVCRKACLDSFGEHAVHCKELPGFKYRHDMVRDVLFDICRRAEISAKKEAPVNFLTDPSDGRSTLRPADVLVFGWVGGKHACVDLTGFLLS
ncbi:hypothetical protein Tco_1383505 [Tanacetum coccineum]